MLGELKSDSTPSPRIYADLIYLHKSSDALGGEFSTCFTELQRNFVCSRPTELKDLIRLTGTNVYDSSCLGHLVIIFISTL